MKGFINFTTRRLIATILYYTVFYLKSPPTLQIVA